MIVIMSAISNQLNSDEFQQTQRISYYHLSYTNPKCTKTWNTI